MWKPVLIPSPFGPAKPLPAKFAFSLDGVKVELHLVESDMDSIKDTAEREAEDFGIHVRELAAELKETNYAVAVAKIKQIIERERIKEATTREERKISRLNRIGELIGQELFELAVDHLLEIMPVNNDEAAKRIAAELGIPEPTPEPETPGRLLPLPVPPGAYRW